MTPLTPEEFRILLSRKCEGKGAKVALAMNAGIPFSAISDVLAGRREPSEAVAQALGFVRRVVFVEVKQGDAR